MSNTNEIINVETAAEDMYVFKDKYFVYLRKWMFYLLTEWYKVIYVGIIELSFHYLCFFHKL
jgi:hypothetical protein